MTSSGPCPPVLTKVWLLLSCLKSCFNLIKKMRRMFLLQKQDGKYLRVSVDAIKHHEKSNMERNKLFSS